MFGFQELLKKEKKIEENGFFIMKIFKENQTKIKLLENLYILKLFNLKINKKIRFEAMYINDILDLILFIFLYLFFFLLHFHSKISETNIP